MLNYDVVLFVISFVRKVVVVRVALSGFVCGIVMGCSV